MQPTFTATNTTSAYQLRYHFAWYTRSRQARFEAPEVVTAINEHLLDISERHEYHLLETQVYPSVARTLISLKPNQSPSRVTNIVRGNLAKHLREQTGIQNVWSRGFFVRSVGNVTADVIRQYVSSQYQHHRAVPEHDPEFGQLARFHNPVDASQVRRDSHSAYEYNIHIVFVTQKRKEFLDVTVAEELVGYWRSVCHKKRWVPWDIEVVSDHAHLLVGLRPKDDPERAALSLMNNSEYFFGRRYRAAMRDSDLTALWQPSFYVGTAGAATTAQVKSFLRSDHF